MGQLIDDFLNLSRVTRHPIRRERVNLNALAEAVASELRKAEPQRQVQFLKQPGGRIELGATQHDDQTAYFVWDRGHPKVDGLEVPRRLRADERTKLLPVVILTSSREEQDIVNGYSPGANSYIRKPVDFGQFTEAVSHLGLYWLLLNEAPR